VATIFGTKDSSKLTDASLIAHVRLNHKFIINVGKAPARQARAGLGRDVATVNPGGPNSWVRNYFIKSFYKII
jgi:hypothetical protein